MPASRTSFFRGGSSFAASSQAFKSFSRRASVFHCRHFRCRNEIARSRRNCFQLYAVIFGDCSKLLVGTMLSFKRGAALRRRL